MQEEQSAGQRNGDEAREKLWTPLFVFIIAVSFFTYMVGQGLNAGTSVYLSYTGYGAALAGFLALLFSVTGALTRVFIGPYLDIRGRFRILIVGACIYIAATFLPALGLGVAGLVAGRLLQGIGFAIGTTASATMASDVPPQSRLGEGIGFFGLGQAVAMAIGPALALYLVGFDRHETLFVGLTVVAVLALVSATQCHYETHIDRLPEHSTYRLRAEKKREAAAGGPDGAEAAKPKPHFTLNSVFERRALVGAVPALVVCPVFGFGIFFVGLYGTHLGVGTPGIFYTLQAVGMIAVRLASNRFMDRTDPFKIMTAGCLFGVAGLVMLLLAGTVLHGTAATAVFYLAGLVYGPCPGLCMPITSTVAVKNTPPERWGAANSLTLLALDVGIGIASLVWGVCNDALGFTITIPIVILCPLAAIVVSKIMFPKHHTEE